MDQPADGARKYGVSDILASSRSRAWRGVTAELRHHPAGELPPFTPDDLEIGIAVACHSEAVVSRVGDGLAQRTRVEPGIVWLCPQGVQEADIRISAWHDVLHVYLPSARFAQHAELCGGPRIGPDGVRYLGGFHDDLIRQVGRDLLAEIRSPSAAGAMRVESSAVSLTVRLVERYADSRPRRGMERPRHKLDERRLRRVLDHMTEHLEDEMSLDDLAAVACLSPFHFARMFAARTKLPPHRYLSRLRLERARALLAAGRLPLMDIALASGFSTQSNFSRAFRRATGTSPLRYRREAR